MHGKGRSRPRGFSGEDLSGVIRLCDIAPTITKLSPPRNNLEFRLSIQSVSLVGALHFAMYDS